MVPSTTSTIREHTILICGNVMLHRKIFPKSFSSAARLTLIRCSEDGGEAFAVWQKLNPSVIVARQAFIERLPTGDLMKVTACGKRARVLAVLDNDTPEGTRKMLQLGCRGVLPSRFTPKLFRRAIAKLLEGEIWANGCVVANLMSELLITIAAKENPLTPREERIRDLILQGFRNSAIADVLFISPETVRWHTRRLYRKIGGSLRPRNLQPNDHRDRAAV